MVFHLYLFIVGLSAYSSSSSSFSFLLYVLPTGYKRFLTNNWLIYSCSECVRREIREPDLIIMRNTQLDSNQQQPWRLIRTCKNKVLSSHCIERDTGTLSSHRIVHVVHDKFPEVFVPNHPKENRIKPTLRHHNSRFSFSFLNHFSFHSAFLSLCFCLSYVHSFWRHKPASETQTKAIKYRFHSSSSSETNGGDNEEKSLICL